MKKLIVFLLLTVLSMGICSGTPDKMEPSFKLLMALHDQRNIMPRAEFAPVDLPWVKMAVKFDHQLSGGEIAALEAEGMEFTRVEGTLYDRGNVYGIKASWEKVSQLEARSDVLQMSSHWKPCVHPCLDVSNPEIQADLTWGMTAPGGLPVTGSGVLVADFDTGIDVFHPGFFRADGDTFDWLDVNGDLQFTPGIDAVDLNGDGNAQSEETLDFFDGMIYDVAGIFGGVNSVGNNDSIYQADWDWLYNDVDNSGVREFGLMEGFSEDDACFGELVFITLDDNSNNSLDMGESVAALGSSKVYATMNYNEVTRMRGTDIIYSGPDVNGHGTGVSGIIAGGIRGAHKFTGIAPEADLIMGYYFDGVSFEGYLPWVESLGCDILLYEFGGWVFNYLDGSSIEEYLVDAYAAAGVLQVLPSGNLNRGYKHCLTNAAAGDTTFIGFEVEEYGGVNPTTVMISVLWLEDAADLDFGIVLPDGLTIHLDGNGSWQTLTPYTFYSGVSESYRGTVEYDILIFADDMTGNWEMFIDNNGALAPEVNGYIADDQSAWEGGAEWIDYLSNMKTVTWPATADSGFVLGSYSTRGFEQYIGVGGGSIQVGMLSQFSGRGPRIDGVSLLSIISPGNYDVYTTKSQYGYPEGQGGWRQFSGTSAAGPHVAGGAALLKQGIPDVMSYEIAQIFEQNAYQDNFTGSVYSDSTGYGKIRIYDALYAMGVIEENSGAMPPRSFMLECYPNPFNAVTSIEFYLPVSGNSEIKVFDLLGRETAAVYQGWLAAGQYRYEFDAEKMASGIYFVQVKSGRYQGIRKVVMVK